MYIGRENNFSEMRREYLRSNLEQVRQDLDNFNFTSKEILYIFKDIKEHLIGALDAIDSLVRLDLNQDDAQAKANQFTDDLARNLFLASGNINLSGEPDDNNQPAKLLIDSSLQKISSFIQYISPGFQKRDQDYLLALKSKYQSLHYNAKNSFERSQFSILFRDTKTGQLLNANDPQYSSLIQKVQDIIIENVPEEVLADMKFTLWRKLFFDLAPNIQEQGFGLMSTSNYLVTVVNDPNFTNAHTVFQFSPTRNPDLSLEQINESIATLKSRLAKEAQEFFTQRILPYIQDKIKDYPEFLGLGLETNYKNMWIANAKYQVAPLTDNPWTGISLSTRINPSEIPNEIVSKLFSPPKGLNLTGEMEELIYGEIFPELEAKGIRIPDYLEVAVTFRFEENDAVDPNDFKFKLAFRDKPDLDDDTLRNINEVYIQREVRERLEARFKDVCRRTVSPRLNELSSRAQQLFKGIRYRAIFNNQQDGQINS